MLSVIRRLTWNLRVRRWTQELVKVSDCDGTIRVNGPWKVHEPGKLKIGDNTHFAGDFFIHAKGEVTIGENCHISRNFICYSYSHNYSGGAIPYDDTSILGPVVIHNNVWIGMNVCVAPGVTIGEGAIVGLGAVVVKDIPPLAIVGGNPAEILKYRDAEHYRDLVAGGRFGGVSGQLVVKKKRR